MIRFDSILGLATTELSMYAQRQNTNKEETQDINVEKLRQPIDCRIHYDEEITNDGSTRATTSCTPSLRHTRRLQQGGNYLFLSLSLTRSIQPLFTKYQQPYENVCPKSYLFIYDFRVIYTNVHTNRSDRSEPVLGSAGSLSIFHPEGHVS